MLFKNRYGRVLGIGRTDVRHVYLVVGLASFVVFALFLLGRVTKSNEVPSAGSVVKRAAVGGGAHDYEEKLVLLITILSSVSVQGAKRRNALRQSWLQQVPKGSETLFFVGDHGFDPELEQAIRDTAREHADVILLDGVRDTYDALTEKVIAVNSWAHRNRHFRYLLKCDDDTFLRPDVFVTELQARPVSSAPPLYWGFFDGRHQPKTVGKWAEKNYVLCDRYIPYAKGGAYVLSSSLVSYIARNEGILVRFNSEDVSVGSWLAPIAVDRKHDPRFDTEYMSRGCDNRFIAMHKQTPEMLVQLSTNLLKRGKQCELEMRRRGSYVYNWSVPPSLCCKRNQQSDSSVP